MSTKDKLIERFKTIPVDFTFDELVSLFSHLGYSMDNKGPTSGSRVSFTKAEDKFLIHRPHPGSIVKVYYIKRLLKEFRQRKLI